MDILNLCDYDVMERDQTKTDYIFKIRYTVRPSSCPHCNRMLPRMQGFGRKEQEYKDLPIHGKRVTLRVIRARYRCLECKQTFYQDLPGLDDKRRATKRFVEYVEEKAQTRTFVSLADELGVVEGTIRNIFKDYVKRMEKTFVFRTPEWLGIDELKLLKKPRCMMANIKERAVFDILESRNQDTVISRLRKIKDRDKIKLVAIDMWEPYLNAVRAVIPQAIVVIDKFHVIRMGNDALDAVRKKIRSELTPSQRRQLMHDRHILLRRKKDLKPEKVFILDTWLGNFPRPQRRLRPQRGTLDHLEMPFSAELAKKMYKEWEDSIPDGVAWAFRDLTVSMSNWEEQIFAYFEHRITNAYTESLNGLTKLANRTGRGYSFEVIRAKILYSLKDGHKKKRPVSADEPRIIIDEIDFIETPGTFIEDIRQLILDEKIPVFVIPFSTQEKDGKNVKSLTNHPQNAISRFSRLP